MAVVINVTGTWNDKDIKKAQADLAKLGKATQMTSREASSSFQSMGSKIKGALIGIGIAKFTTDSIHAFADAELSQAKLAAAFERFPALADTNIDALRDLNSELQKHTIYDDDATAAAQALLAQYQLTGKQIAELTPLMQDFATATGQDITSAASALGKALMGNTRAMKDVGIQFTATGDRAKDFETMVAALRTQVGGLADKEGKTAAGQLAIMNNAVGDLEESVGEALMPALQALMGTITPVVRAFSALPAPVRSVTLMTTAAAGAFVLLAPRIAATRTALQGMGAAGGVAASGMGKMTKAAGLATTALVAIQVAGSTINSMTKGLQLQSNTATQLSESFKQAAASGKMLTTTGGELEGRAFSLNEALLTLAAPGLDEQLDTFISSLTGATSQLDAAQTAVTQVDTALAQLVGSGNAKAAAEQYGMLRDSYVAAGGSADDFTRLMPAYNDALITGANSAETAASAVAKLPPPLDLAKRGAERLTAAWKALDGTLSKQDARDTAIKSLQDLDKALGKSKGSLHGNSEAVLDSREALRSSIGDIAAYAQAFKDKPIKQIAILNDETKKIRQTLRANGVSEADIDKYLGPLLTMRRKAQKAGEDLAGGLAQGILSGRANAIAQAEDLGRAAVAAVRRGADAHSPSRYTFKVGEDIVKGLSGGVLKDAGGAKKVIRDATHEALTAARDELDKFHAKGQQVLDFIKAIRGNVTSFGSVTGFQAGEGPTTLRGVITSMQGRVAEARKFADAVAKLRGLHLNNASLQEIISAGPHAGLQIAQALLAGGRAAVSQVNSLESQLNASAASVGDTAGMSAYGRTAAQARGMVQTNVRVEKGAVVVHVGAGTKPGDAAWVAKAVQDGVDKALDKFSRELARGHR